MGTIYKIIAGIGTLIAIYLFLSHSAETANIISTVASNSIKGVQVLQGRDNYMK